MSKPDIQKLENLKKIFEKRSFNVLSRFRQTATSGIKDLELISVLEKVKEYWNDTFRPSLISLCCETVGGQPTDTEDISLMITLMAAGLGIHDDIIDRSTSKHFRMTLFGLYDLDTTLLAGELFIVKALTTIRQLLKKNFSNEKLIYITEIFEEFFIEVWEGEYLETRCRRNLDTRLEHYKQMLWMSTADIEACARLGSLIGHGSNYEVEALAEFGRRLGFMFQLFNQITDTLNVDGALFDKLDRESVPLPILYASKCSEDSYRKIKSILEKDIFLEGDIFTILNLCFETKAFNYVYNLAKKNKKRALEKLYLLKPSDSRDILELMLLDSFDKFSNLKIFSINHQHG